MLLLMMIMISNTMLCCMLCYWYCCCCFCPEIFFPSLYAMMGWGSLSLSISGVAASLDSLSLTYSIRASNIEQSSNLDEYCDDTLSLLLLVCIFSSSFQLHCTCSSYSRISLPFLCLCYPALLACFEWKRWKREGGKRERYNFQEGESTRSTEMYM